MLCGRGQLIRQNRHGTTRARVQYFIEAYEGIAEIKGAPRSFGSTAGWMLCDSEGTNWVLDVLDSASPAADGWIRVSVKRASAVDAA